MVFSSQVKVSWPDGHHSQFSSGWLQARKLDDANIEQRRNERTGRVRDQVLWNRELAQTEVKRFAFKDVMNTEEALLEWLLCQWYPLLFLCALAIINSFCRPRVCWFDNHSGYATLFSSPVVQEGGVCKDHSLWFRLQGGVKRRPEQPCLYIQHIGPPSRLTLL